jgi:hypothetical protein
MNADIERQHVLMQDDGEFVSVGDFVPPEAPPAAGENPRVDDRVPTKLRLNATLLNLPGRPMINFVAHHLSRSGIEFSTVHTFAIGEYFAITLKLGNGSKTLLCRTTFCNPVEHGKKSARAEFVDSVAADSQGVLPQHWIGIAAGKSPASPDKT